LFRIGVVNGTSGPWERRGCERGETQIIFGEQTVRAVGRAVG
jgi:hypothetical protein